MGHKPHLNQGSPSIFEQTDQKGHLCMESPKWRLRTSASNDHWQPGETIMRGKTPYSGNWNWESQRGFAALFILSHSQGAWGTSTSGVKQTATFSWVNQSYFTFHVAQERSLGRNQLQANTLSLYIKGPEKMTFWQITWLSASLRVCLRVLKYTSCSWNRNPALKAYAGNF